MPEWNVCGRGFDSRRLHHASPKGYAWQATLKIAVFKIS